MEKHYKLEGGIDFYAELYKSLDESDSDKETDENNNDNNKEQKNKDVCLITNQKLEDKYVKMGCGHTFNYIPIYNDILNHKTKFNNMESTSNRLKMDEIRCPYCRYKQQGLLPYYAELGLKEIYGVNSCNPNCILFASNCIYMCEWPECPRGGHRVFMNKRYCTPHLWFIKKGAAVKKKQEKEAKMKAKEEEKQKKLEEKQKKLEEKQKKLEEKEKTPKPKVVKKKVPVENTIISENLVVLTDSSEIITSNFCTIIMKTGPRKGEICGLDVHSENMCKRHFNLANKLNVNDK